ncbi:hypothetical protein HYFRA_00001549 [Hymenoscyphus fraxineus]|uniref:3-phytase n=1 Tax=Hymenoscyphus fraxineus TaxID=746836 RepID=A0A9N9PTY1_9HELO|nr:hypothetical protein HYFRA_00001549 [Hymenoscyphus fraxineus]
MKGVDTVVVVVGLVLGAGVGVCGELNPVYLSPVQDLVFPVVGSGDGDGDGDGERSPLMVLGANSPWFGGPNVNNESNDTPQGCTVEQVAYVVRHGSRFPDQGAYNEWVALYNKIQNSTFTASGSLEFLKTWKPVLTHPSLQIAQESPTGYKEAYDLGYRLRTRYPDLYAYGSPFMAWANLYPRVVQTAQNFVRGFLGSSASTLGTVVTVNSTGSPQAIFDSLAPSDLCPNFRDGNGGVEGTIWSSTYLPPITARLNALVTGNLTFAPSDVSIFPYLCGFESQITGQFSPWCSVFTAAELLQYEYAQDLRYYYGTGDGTDLPSKMMLPFLNSLLGLLGKGPGQVGQGKNGTFKVPDIVTAFLNDGQLTELVAATGVMGDQKPLNGSAMPAVGEWKYVASRFVSMRGTVAFERLSCSPVEEVQSAYDPPRPSPSNSTSGKETYIRILLNDAVYPVPTCQDGPGRSCALEEYTEIVARKLGDAGDLRGRCNVSEAVRMTGNGTSGRGASFFTELGGAWLGSVVP